MRSALRSAKLELHDKEKVEVYGYYCGIPRSNDKTHDRIRAVMDGWCDINGMSDIDVAKKIIDDEIDILIDVNGYTKQARAGVFAYRPAPVIVNFCGYPGNACQPVPSISHHRQLHRSAGARALLQRKGSAHSLRAAGGPQAEIASKPTRAEYGLPDDAFIYACFNGMQKITEACFLRWMKILAATPGSILWLLGDKDPIHQRLRKIASENGVDPDRIYFATKVPTPSIWPALRLPTCSWIPSPMAPIQRRQMPLPWGFRS